MTLHFLNLGASDGVLSKLGCVSSVRQEVKQTGSTAKPSRTGLGGPQGDGRALEPRNLACRRNAHGKISKLLNASGNLANGSPSERQNQLLGGDGAEKKEGQKDVFRRTTWNIS